MAAPQIWGAKTINSVYTGCLIAIGLLVFRMRFFGGASNDSDDLVTRWE